MIKWVMLTTCNLKRQQNNTPHNLKGWKIQFAIDMAHDSTGLVLALAFHTKPCVLVLVRIKPLAINYFLICVT